jgi:uncharacterized lipoprotein YddW (UPF0748 family)
MFSMTARVRLLIPLLFVTFAAAQATPPGLEPGEAEARQRTTDARLPVKFTRPTTEVRGIWLASRDMTMPREDLRNRLDQLKSAHFNTVLIDTYFRGYVAYPGSEHLPQFPDFNGEDVLAFLIDECHQRGMKADLWMEYGFYSYFTPDATKDPSMGQILDEHPELLSVDADGTRFIHRSFGDFYSICPSNPKSHQILADIFAEAVRKYPAVNGLNLDRIRYAAGNYCYCDYCKTHFHGDTGIELTKFAQGSVEDRKFLEWKRQQTAKAVATIVRSVRAVKSDLPITSYVVGPDEMDDKAQGWDLWMQQGLLDGIAVSMYGGDIRPATEKAVRLLGPSRDKLIAAISCDQETPVYLTNIELSRGYRMMGQYTWHFGDVFDDLDALTAGPYAAPAESPLDR